jgi:hypothetical protein
VRGLGLIEVEGCSSSSLHSTFFLFGFAARGSAGFRGEEGEEDDEDDEEVEAVDGSGWGAGGSGTGAGLMMRSSNTSSSISALLAAERVARLPPRPD